VACPDRKVLALTGDGAGMYTVQGLWTIVRERLDVTVVVFANQAGCLPNRERLRITPEPFQYCSLLTK
jgi:thiamine pyrophosphate-dependent acetolactate synthase large subunit-like protein